ncbi:bile acid:sodium symporter [Croceicoccus estronivorus]|uniref:bile acid:sodium symporter family protein n=1 Tax=Croceicoccus estronivorus TaxID=1172626 RepID=UPI00082F411E|nr:bile acid:sodium symporter family protein [Croceicoccus estronivorus]OCC24434.1 bile acid:sodium symporter [Croceicoccus estronivorus]
MFSKFAALNRVDPFLVVLVSVVTAASFFPVHGAAVPVAKAIANLAIMLLFFLHGAKLSRQAILAGIVSWRVHVLVLAATFVLFPALGLLIYAAHLPIDPALLTGLLFLTLLPSTVQSSVAFTAIAGGNVAAAVCSASLSNIAGIVVTPLLTGVLIDGSAGVTTDSLQAIAFQLLLPFIAGHLCRPLLSGFLNRYKTLVSKVDRGSILIVVYNAFSAAVVAGIWNRLDIADLVILLLANAVLLGAVMLSTWSAARWFKLSVEDQIVVLFCGSKKSLVSGVPMASALFPAALAGPIILPLMLFHQLQLMVCAVVAQRYRSHGETVALNSAVAGSGPLR